MLLQRYRAMAAESLQAIAGYVEADPRRRITMDQFKCQQCGSSFESREKLDQHNKQMHGSSQAQGGGQQQGSQQTR
jgi:hypothetical protein